MPKTPLKMNVRSMTPLHLETGNDTRPQPIESLQTPDSAANHAFSGFPLAHRVFGENGLVPRGGSAASVSRRVTSRGLVFRRVPCSL